MCPFILAGLQIERIDHRNPAAAHKGIKRIPISPAMLLKHLPRASLPHFVGPSRTHQTPVCRHRLSWAIQIFHTPIVI